MTIEDKILKKIFEYGSIENENTTFQGIAERAKDNGYNSLSEPQKSVISKLFSIPCAGYTDPGDFHHDCNYILSGEEIINGLVESHGDLDNTQCPNCLNQYYADRHSFESFCRD